MCNKELVDGIRNEISRLRKKQPDLEFERLEVFKAIDKASFLTPNIRTMIHVHYDHELERVRTDISSMTQHLKWLEGGG